MIVLVTGAGGQVGTALVREAERRGIRCIAAGRHELDITDSAAIDTMFDRTSPGVVVNLAAYTRVDAAETERAAAFDVNAKAVESLGRACDRTRTPMLHISSDYVFDGSSDHAYVETDPVHPINVYGSSKAAGEEALRRTLDTHLIVRTSWVFGTAGRNFVRTMLRLAAEHDEVRVVADEIGCPTAADALAGTLLTLAEHVSTPGFAHWGTYHYCGAPAVSRAAFARAIFDAAERVGGLRSARVMDIAGSEFPTTARRPARSVLDCARIERVLGIAQQDWRAALEPMLRELARSDDA